MIGHSSAAFYRRGNSVTSQICGQDADGFDATPRAAASHQEEFMNTPPFAPSRWSSDSPQAYNGVISASQKLDRGSD